MAELKKYRVRLPSGRETVLKLSEASRAENFPDAVPADAPKPEKRATKAQRKPRTSSVEAKEKSAENKAHTPEDK